MKFDKLIDSAGKMRRGEELQSERLQEFLADRLNISGGKLSIKQFPGGFSNLTYLVSVGDRQWVLRRPPFGNKVKSAHDMSREFRILSALKNIFDYAPEPLAFCDDHSVLGSDFYLMEYIRGIVIRKDYPREWEITPDKVRTQLLNMFDALADLHSISIDRAGLGNFGKPTGYVARQVKGWSERYLAAMTPDCENCDAVIVWLRDNLPQESPLTSVIHNDFKLDNVIWSSEDPLKLIGVLDWEMSTVGDPLMDLGCTLGYWVESSDPEFLRQYRTMPSDVPGAPTRSEIVDRFSQRFKISITDFPFYFCFGLFRLAAIGQQIYYRYYHGLTHDHRFKAMVDKSRSLKKMCELIMAGKIES